jgi:HAE1 family hydrophobic/amphiphilic exporter-1
MSKPKTNRDTSPAQSVQQAAMDLPGVSVRRPYLATVLNLLIIVAGIAAIFGVEVRELPNVDRPVVTVRADYPGAAPETVDAEVTSKVEAAVARVGGVKEIRSSSEEGNFRIRVVFTPATDLIDAANDVREAVSRVERNLPPEVENLTVIKADADAQPIVALAVSSGRLPIEDLTRRVETEVIPELTAIDGVADVVLFGERERVLRVVLDPMRLASYGLSVNAVVEVLRNARFDIPTGSFKSAEQEVLVRANATVTQPRDIEALKILPNVRIADIGRASYGQATPESIVRLDGRTVIRLGVVRRAQSNTVAISDGVSRAVAQMNARTKDFEIATTSDDAVFIRGAIEEVLISLALAVLIVTAVLAVSLGSLRMALIPTIAIPVALIGTVATIWLLGFSINLITLLALVLATGLVVDDAIVVLENIQRLRGQGAGARAAAILGTRQVFFAVLATTATLISVFLPISFLPSTAGRLFGEFGFVLAMTVCISSFVALTIVPMLASRIGVGGKPDTDDGAPADSRKSGIGIGALLGWIGDRLTATFGAVLKGVLKAPLVAIALASVIFIAAFAIYDRLGEELVPEEDRGLITVFMTGPDGTGLDFTDRQVEKVEAILRPYVDQGTATGLFSITGRYDPNRGQVEAPLADWSQRSISEGEIATAVNRQLSQIPGASARVRRGNSLGLRGGGSRFRFALTGSDYSEIADAAQKFVAVLERETTAVVDLRVEYRATQPQLSLQIDRKRATDLGVPMANLSATLRALIDSDEVAELTVGDERIPIVVQAVEGAVKSPADLANLFVPSTDGRLVSLAQLVTVTEEAIPSELDRHGQRRAVEVFADLGEGVNLRDAVTAVRGLATANLPPGIGLLFLDEAAALNETASGVGLTYAIALLIVFLVLVAQFESVTSAVVVLLTVPFGICAAILALFFTGTTINIYSQIGVLMLIGIMAKNAILMVEFADQLRDRGWAVYDAAFEAATVRLRPILMTMMSTVLAGLPLVFATGPGSEARAAIGWVVFGGLGLAGIFTLLLTPAFYVLVAGLVKPRSAEDSRIAAELSDAETALDTVKQ